MEEIKPKPWKDFSLEEKICFGCMLNLSDEEIARSEGIKKEEVQKICKKKCFNLLCERRDHKIWSIEDRVSYLHSTGLGIKDIAYEIHICDLSNLSDRKKHEQKIREICEKLGLAENPKKYSSFCYGSYIPDPSH